MSLPHLSLRGYELTIHFRFDPQSANTGSTNPSGGPNIAAILGGVIGGLFLLLIAIVFFWLRRRRNKKRSKTEEGSTDTPPSPPSTNSSKAEMTMVAVTPVVTQSTRPRVRFGEPARPGMEEPLTTGRSETPPSIRPMRSILRRQESNNSDAPLLTQTRMDRPDDQVSLASTANSGPDVSNSSLTVAPPDSRRPSPAPSLSAAPVRPPRPPQALFTTGDIPNLPEPNISDRRFRTLNEDPFNSNAAENAQSDVGTPLSDSTLVFPNPHEEMESTGRSNTASPAPTSPGPLMLRTENVPQPAPEQRSTTQARKDLLAALETEQVTTLSRSGTRKVGLPSNPRAGLSRENSSKY
jgi:hypothetical protein